LPVDDLALLLDAAEAAGRIAKRHFRGSFEVSDKGGGLGPVTEADLEIDRMLKAELVSTRPDYGWLSEESEDDAARLDAEHVFIVDPIDGTRLFVAGNTTFAHSLAIAKNGTVVCAVVLLPMRELTYHAIAGGPAILNGEKVRASDKTGVVDAKILAAKPQLAADLWPGGVPPVERHFRSSLAYRMCLIAQGRFDGMVTLRDAWEWDIAAGDLICRAAGAISTDKHGVDLRFNNPSAKTAGVLAAGSGVHGGLMAHLSK
jgi:myo-inositol-1(or 4)-monophosphatase